MIPGVTLITGANGGLGSEIVKSLLSSGVENIACHYRSECDVITNILEEKGLDPANYLFKAELTAEDQVHQMREEIEQKLGPVYNLVNLAGGSTNGVSWKLSREQYQEVIDMNLTSTFVACKEFIPGMRERGYGRIINTSSVVGSTGVPGASHYCASKAAVLGYSKSIALELVNKNITVNTVSLGYFNTGLIHDVPEELQEQIKAQIPIKRFGEPKEIASAIMYLLRQDAGYTTGQVIHINGGLY